MGINGLSWDFIVCQWELLPYCDIIHIKKRHFSGFEGTEVYAENCMLCVELEIALPMRLYLAGFLVFS